MTRALVLSADQFEDMELFFPVFRLLEEGIDVDVAAPAIEEIHGENGYSFMPDKTIAEVNPDDYDLLIIPGGSPDGAPSAVRKIKKARDIAKSFMDKNKRGQVIARHATPGGRRILVSANSLRHWTPNPVRQSARKGVKAAAAG